MSAGRYTLRQARVEDAAQFAEVHRLAREAVYPGFVGPETLTAQLAATGETYWRDEIPDESELDEFYVVAEAGGRIVGLASLKGEIVDRLYVLPAWWGSGLAQVLFAAVRQQAVEGGRRQIVLETHVENARARRFYARLGGVEIGTRVERCADGTPARVVDIAWELP